MTALNVTFYVKETLDERRTKLEARDVYVPVEYKKTRIPGSPDFTVTPVSEADRGTETYRRWKSGQADGTPVEVLLGRQIDPANSDVRVTEEIKDDWKAAGVRTVEQLAALTDAARGIPLLFATRRMAAAFLAEADSIERVAEVQRREADFAQLRARVEQLEAENARFRAMREEGVNAATR